MSDSFSYFVDSARKNLCDWHTMLQVNEFPYLYFGDNAILTLRFKSGTIEAGDTVGAAVDRDFRFWDSETSEDSMPLTACYHVVTPDEASSQTVELTLESRYEKLRDAVNGTASLGCYLGIGVRRSGDQSHYSCLCISQMTIRSIVADVGSVPVIVPHDIYYTKEEINAIKAAMDELVGDAAESAGEAQRYAEQAGQASAGVIEARADAIAAATQATQSASDASGYAAAASSSASESMKWAEGTDAEAQALGGLHSCKGWHDLIAASYASINLGPCKDMAVYFGSNENNLMWTDPDDVVINGSTIARWKKTVLVRKEGSSYPENPSDGTVVATTSLELGNKSAYRSAAFIDSGLESGTQYCYRLFSYSTLDSFNVLEENKYPYTTTWWPQLVHQFSQAGTLLNYMSVGQGMVIHHPEFDNSSGYDGQLVQLVGYDCVQTASGTGHAAVFQFVDLLYSSTNNYSTMSFDPAESQYALTDDELAVAGKTYYTLSGTTYTALSEGTDWTAGDPVPANSWYEKNPNPNYGNGTNKYDQSNLRQYLNSEGSANNWWTKQNLWDAGAYESRNGFLYAFPFADILVPIRKKVARSSTYGGGYVECVDRIFLPSNYEIFGTAVGGVNEGIRRWDWFAAHTENADRIKYLNGAAAIWWLSSPLTSNGAAVFNVAGSGMSFNANSGNSYGVAPAFAL